MISFYDTIQIANPERPMIGVFKVLHGDEGCPGRQVARLEVGEGADLALRWASRKCGGRLLMVDRTERVPALANNYHCVKCGRGFRVMRVPAVGNTQQSAPKESVLRV